MAFEAALNLDVSGFSNGIKKASNDVKSLGASLGSIAGGAIMAGLSAAAAAAGAAVAGMYSAMEAGGALVDLSEQTGIAIDKLMVLQTAFKQAGMSAEDVQPVINKMQKAIVGAATAGGPAAEAFQRLGLSAAELSGMGADEQLQAIGEAISKIQNPAQKAAIAMEVFGKSGGRALALFAAGGLDDAAAAVGNQARLMRDNAGVFDRITDVLGTAATKLQGLFVGMASEVAPMILSAVEAFNSIDLSGLGQQIGSVVAIVLEAFSSGTLGTLVMESLNMAFIASVNVLSSVLSAAIAGVIQYWIESFSLLTSSDFWGGMLTTLVGIAQQFIGFMVNGIAKILAMWKDVPVIGEGALKASQAAARYAAEVSARGAGNMSAGSAVLLPKLADSAANIANAAKTASEVAPQMEQSTVPVIGEGALKASESAAAYGAEVSARGAGNTSAGSAVLLPKLADSAANIASAAKAAYDSAPQMEQSAAKAAYDSAPQMEQSAAKAAYDSAPQMEQSTAFSNLIDKLKAQASKTQTATREKLTTEKPAGLGIEGLTRKEGGFTSMGNQLSSLQKVGGGGSMIGGAAIDFSRQQLDEQKRSNQFLGVIATALTTREMGITPYGALA